MYQRNLIKGLAKLPVGLIGIDCKRGVEQGSYAARLSALATTPDEADRVLDVVETLMEDRFDLLAQHRVSTCGPCGEGAAGAVGGPGR